MTRTPTEINFDIGARMRQCDAAFDGSVETLALSSVVPNSKEFATFSTLASPYTLLYTAFLRAKQGFGGLDSSR